MMKYATLIVNFLISLQLGSGFLVNNGELSQIPVQASQSLQRPNLTLYRRPFQAGQSTIRLADTALELASESPDRLKEKFTMLKKAFPADMNAVKAGGWSNIQKLSGDPKQELVDMIVSGLKDGEKKVEFAADQEKLEALTILLYGMGKGFEADLVHGDWALVFSRQGQKSPRFQRLVGKKEKAGYSMNVFDIKSKTFSGNIKILKKGLVHSTVKYDPTTDAYSKTSDGKIVLRRIGCDIANAYFKFWRLPGLALPLRAKGGYLEFIYMDKDIRVTKGNRGGLFVHFRPEFLEAQLEK